MNKINYTDLFDNIFDSRAKTKILRFLTNSDKNNRYTCRAVAKALNISPATASALLSELENMNILKKEIISKSHLYCYNTESYLVSEIILPIFEKERRINETAGKYIADTIKKYSLSIVLFGSSATKTDTIISDYDVLIISENNSMKVKIEKLLNDISNDFSLRFGKPLAPYILSLSELRSKYRGKLSLIMDVLKYGKLLYGKRLQTLINKK